MEVETWDEIPKKCTECGSRSCRITYGSSQKESNKCRVDALMQENIRLSRSLGCLPNQLKDCQKLHPGANFVKMKDGSYAMEIKHRQEKKQRMKERGMIEYSQNDFKG